MLYTNSDRDLPIEDFSAGLRTTGTFFSRVQTSPKTMNAISGKGKTLKKRPGFDVENLPGLEDSPVTGLYDYGISSNSRKQIIHVGSNLYKMDELNGTWQLLQTNITNNAVSEFETFTTSSGNVLLHATHENDTIKSWDGSASTMTEVSGSGAPAPKYLKAWNNHVWAAGIVNNPSRLRYSNVATYTNWQTNSIDNYDDNFQTSDGDYITGLAVLRGNLYVFKRYSIFRVTYLGGTPLISVLQVISGTGCISNKSIVEAEVTTVDTNGSSKKQVLVFLTADKKIVAFDGSTIYPMSDIISDNNMYSPISMATLNDAGLTEAHAIFLSDADLYLLFVADSTNQSISHCFALNTVTRGIFPWDNMEFKSSAIMVTTQNKKIPYVGGYNGQVYRLMYGSKDVSSTLVPNLVSLLHFDGADSSTIITDYLGNTWTSNGGAQLDQTQAKFGQSSLLLDGTDDYVSCEQNSNWDFSGGKWSVDCQVYLNSIASDGVVWSQGTDANNYMQLVILSTGEVQFDIVTASSTVVTMVSSGLGLTTGSWYLIEVGETGDAYKLYVDGVVVASTTDTDRAIAYAGAFEIGRIGFGTANYLNGWVDEFRVFNGAPAHTAAYTAPTEAYETRTFSNVNIDMEYELDLVDSKRPDTLKKGRYVLIHLKPRSNTTINLSRAMQYQQGFHSSTVRTYVTDASSFPLGVSLELGSGTLGGDFGSTLVYDMADNFNHFRLRIDESSTLESFEIHRIDIVMNLEGIGHHYFSGVSVS